MSKHDLPNLPLAGAGEFLARQQSYAVRQNARYRWLEERKSIQSIMDRGTPSELVLPTHHAMFCAIAAIKHPGDILNLGCGPGAVERKLEKSFGHTRCISVDASPDVFELAKQYFFWANSRHFILSSAEEYLEKAKQRFNIIMVDLFVNELNAKCVYELEFYENIAACLSTDGIVSMNLIPQNQNDLLSILLPLRKKFSSVWFSEIQGRSNIVILGSKNVSFNLLESIQICAHDDHQFGFNPMTVAQKFIRLPDAIP